jgi:3-hydroxyacyl-[acyl-carrier-protein] dehydratase
METLLCPGVALRDPAPIRDGWEGLIDLGADCPFFAGHFPHHPVLPAMGQLWLLCELLVRLAGIDPIVEEIPRVKFLKPMAPGVSLSFTLVIDPARSRVSFQLSEGGQTVSIGDLRLRPGSLG